MLVTENTKALLARRKKERARPSIKFARRIAGMVELRSCSVTQLEQILDEFAAAIVYEAVKAMKATHDQ